MILHRLNILLASLGIATGISMLTIIHAHDFQRSPEARHWIAPGTDAAGEVKRHTPRG
ncbi:hypothetical protein [Skermanella aerolata]|uniref:hypothetical protein n=1 Tax=Skermanella aerolata TaxID=393310 RepID=UPI0012F71F02|nr:hypothetical protein [Skermanella aerolata]